MQSILPFSLLARENPVEGFVEECSFPVFIIESAEEELGSGFETITEGVRGGAIGFSVSEIKKREGANAFGMWITIGRARNNDIHLPSAQVSKFHAYVTLDGDVAHITDAGSTCGTMVRGRKLEPRVESAVLRDGDKALLGGVMLTYFVPASFYAYLLSM